MIELTNALKAVLYDRAKKPFTGTFALAWLVINWKIWVTLFFVSESKLGGLSRTDYIQNNLVNIKDNLLLPLGITALLIFLLPTLNLGALFIKKQFDDWEFMKILKKTPADGTQVGELLETIKNQREKFTLQLNELNELNISLQNKIDDKEKEIKILKSQISDKDNTIKSSKELAPKLKEDLQHKENEYKKAVKIINDYRLVLSDLTKEFGNSKNESVIRRINDLDSIKLRGSSRLKDMT